MAAAKAEAVRMAAANAEALRMTARPRDILLRKQRRLASWSLLMRKRVQNVVNFKIKNYYHNSNNYNLQEFSDHLGQSKKYIKKWLNDYRMSISLCNFSLLSISK